ncbi:hypothetical protein KO465_01085 [Candidatus Micrarchaeota archaeon]|jgi:hypothetical protein|nr:hypothetical protein [Candidatus Micrarchaeota archaeon]
MELSIENLKKNWILVLVGVFVLLALLSVAVFVGLPIFIALLMNTQAPEMCDPSSQGFICNDPIPVINGNKLEGRIGNGMQQPVMVYQIGCTDDLSADPMVSCNGESTTLSDSEYGTFESLSNSEVVCPNSDNTPIGGNYKGKMVMAYKFPEDEIIAVNCRYMHATINIKKVS